ncbi:MAG TPA: exodeoxyribonuclease VII large subunit, partial [Caulobacteraceae bacterium]
ELRAFVTDLERRMIACTGRGLEERRGRLRAAERGLPRPDDLLGAARQRLDHAALRLSAGLTQNARLHERRLLAAASHLTPGRFTRQIDQGRQRLTGVQARLDAAILRVVPREADRLARTARLLESLNPERAPGPGFVRVHAADGTWVRSAAALSPGEAVTLKFTDGDRAALIDGAPSAPRPAKPKPAAKAPPPQQGDLF